ncbi:MAG: hypothetical protein H6562_21635 [Lewinellaceae bacterium]|nr:hypothetical protein [Lewinella sp.]MCB9281504.1 hypothetical protein [Lewinellaceae bacterium]
MITVARVVENLVRQSPFISEALSEGLINVSSLARKLQPEVEKILKKEVKVGAIGMAVQRLNPGALLFEQRKLVEFFRKVSDLSVRTSLLDYTYRNSETLPEKQAQLLELISRRPNVFYTFAQGITETVVIVADWLEADVERVFQEEKLLYKEDHLAGITLILPEDNRQLSGVYYFILKELAWVGVNLVEVVSTSNEFTIIVQMKDLDQALGILTGLSKLRGR